MDANVVGVRSGIDLAEETSYRIGLPDEEEAPKPRLTETLSRLRSKIGWRRNEKQTAGASSPRRSAP